MDDKLYLVVFIETVVIEILIIEFLMTII